MLAGSLFHLPVEDGASGVSGGGGLVCSVRFHFDPAVQAAGEHHPTDLKTGGVKSKSAAPRHRGRLQGACVLQTARTERGLKVTGEDCR